MLHIAIILGTRPEAIKMAPLILALKKAPAVFRTSVILSGQHAHLVSPILDFFGIHPDVTIRLMRPGQTLSALTSRAIGKMTNTLDKLKPDWVIVQGDTTTAMTSALAAFYLKIPVAHLEAGLRTNTIYSPFPEEVNRRIISQIAKLHWAPTPEAAVALRLENHPLPSAKITVTGNTVIDALFWSLKKVRQNPGTDKEYRLALAHKSLGKDRLLVLITGHRRENLGSPLQNICQALLKTAQSDPKTLLIYPIHPNPQVQKTVRALLSKQSNILLTTPKDYPDFLRLLDLSDIIVTDSGGVQEEAPALGKTVIVTRESTERPEGLRSGLVKLAGNKPGRLYTILHQALKDHRSRKIKMKAVSPYGDGRASERCLASLLGKPVRPYKG